MIFLIALLVFVIDRITKVLVLNIASPLVVSPFLTFSLTQNKGIAFGLFSGYSGLIFWLTLILCIALIAYSIFLKKGLIFTKIGIGMFIGGAISNLLDRIIHSSVIDFISIGIGNLRWPTFNIADCGIVIGAILIVLAGKVKGSAGS